jgi:flagellar protein FlaG
MDIESLRGNLDPVYYPFKRDKTAEGRYKDTALKDPVEKGNEPSRRQETAFVADAIEKLKKAGDIFNRRLEFKVDENTHRIVVKVIDTETDKVIKEIPPEQIIALAAKIQEMVGLLVDEER